MTAILKLSTGEEAKMQWLLDRARANGGLAPVELDRFWADQKVADADPFGLRIPQLALGIAMSGECVYDELGVAEAIRARQQLATATQPGLQRPCGANRRPAPAFGIAA